MLGLFKNHQKKPHIHKHWRQKFRRKIFKTYVYYTYKIMGCPPLLPCIYWICPSVLWLQQTLPGWTGWGAHTNISRFVTLSWLISALIIIHCFIKRDLRGGRVPCNSCILYFLVTYVKYKKLIDFLGMSPRLNHVFGPSMMKYMNIINHKIQLCA